MNNTKKLNLNKIVKPVLFLIVALILEVIQFSILNYQNQNGQIQLLPAYIFLDLGVWLVMAGIIFVFNKRWLQNIFLYAFIIIQIVINITNSIINNSLGYVFYFKLLSLTSEGINAFNWGLVNWGCVAGNLIIFVVLIIAQIVIDKYCKKTFSIKKKFLHLISYCGMLVCCAIGVSSYALQVNAFSDNDKDIWSELVFKNYSMQQFGTYGFYLKDIANTINPPSSEINKEDALKKINRGNTQENKDAILYGDNVIVVMLESFDWFAIDPYNTPTIYNLLDDSVVFSNFISNNKTNISEDIGLIGYMPFDEKLNITKNDGLTTEYSLPNLFKAQGYQTNYIHSYISTFYNRNVINKNIGFDNLYFIEDADIDDKSVDFDMWNSEIDVFNSFKEQIAPTDGSKFMSFYLTVGTHGRYNSDRFSRNFEQYEKNVKETDYVNWMKEQGYIFPEDEETYALLREFKSAAIDTDLMVADLLEHLNKENADGTRLIDNTSVVFYADHNAYYHDLCYKLKGTDSKDVKNLKSYNVPLFIYSQKLQAQKIETFTHTYDIYPTICQLYGLPYNTFMALGETLINADGTLHEDAYRIYYSQLSGYYTQNFFSTSPTTPVPISETASDKEKLIFLERVWDYYSRQKILNYVYKYEW